MTAVNGGEAIVQDPIPSIRTTDRWRPEARARALTEERPIGKAVAGWKGSKIIRINSSSIRANPVASANFF